MIIHRLSARLPVRPPVRPSINHDQVMYDDLEANHQLLDARATQLTAHVESMHDAARPFRMPLFAALSELSALERRDPAHAALPSSSVAPLRAQSLFQVIVGWSAMK